MGAREILRDHPLDESLLPQAEFLCFLKLMDIKAESFRCRTHHFLTGVGFRRIIHGRVIYSGRVHARLTIDVFATGESVICSRYPKKRHKAKALGNTCKLTAYLCPIDVCLWYNTTSTRQNASFHKGSSCLLKCRGKREETNHSWFDCTRIRAVARQSDEDVTQ